MRLTIEQLEKLTTSRLLSYFKKNRVFRTHFDNNDEYNEEDEYWDSVRLILNNREHVEKRKKS